MPEPTAAPSMHQGRLLQWRLAPKNNIGGKACNGQPGEALLQTTIGASKVGTHSRFLFEGKYLLRDQRLAHREKIRIVDSQHTDRRPPNRCPALQLRSHPLEMFAPNIPSRMKETDDFARRRIVSRDVRPFMPIAMPMLARNDVVHVEWQGIKAGRQVAILASILGPAPDSRESSRFTAWSAAPDAPWTSSPPAGSLRAGSRRTPRVLQRSKFQPPTDPPVAASSPGRSGRNPPRVGIQLLRLVMDFNRPASSGPK